MNLPVKVKLREVSTRDGFQSLEGFIPTQTKVEIIDRILNAGIKEIEATSFVNPNYVPQLRDASELISLLPNKDGRDVVYAALVPNLKGARAAINAGVDKIVVVVSASDSHNQANIRRTVRQSLHELKNLFGLAAYKNILVVGSIAVAFGCPYEGSIDISNVLKIAETFLSLGADSIILADTVGVANPRHVSKMIDAFKKHLQSEEFLTLHFHNNYGTAMANLLAAMDSGVNSFDTALGGIGGCPYVPTFAGNLPTEDAVRMLEGMGITTGVSPKKITSAASFLEQMAMPGLREQAAKHKTCTT